MKALVTGANGFTGSHLVKELLKQGYAVKGLVRKTSDLKRLQGCQVELIYGDITDSSVVNQAMSGVDILFHLAAYVELGLVDESEMKRVNVEGTRTVLEIAKQHNITKLIYCSTIGIFGDTKGKVIDETFTRKQNNFSSAYDRTKYEAQQLVDQFAQDGLPVISIMPSGIMGADDPHFTPVFDLFLSGKLKFWLGGDRITGIVDVDDLVKAMILAIEKGKNGEYYIISAGELTTKEMFLILENETGIKSPQEIPEIIARAIGNILDVIGRIFNWNPPLSRERLHYIYDRCVRVSADKARYQLHWNHSNPTDCLKNILKNIRIL